MPAMQGLQECREGAREKGAPANVILGVRTMLAILNVVIATRPREFLWPENFGNNGVVKSKIAQHGRLAVFLSG
jgi:hypothetical protein